jgi:hypothetical protein
MILGQGSLGITEAFTIHVVIVSQVSLSPFHPKSIFFTETRIKDETGTLRKHLD